MTKLLVLACAAVVTSGAATAQNAPKPVSRAEYLKAVDGRFNAMDTNHDGKVTRDELAAQQQRELQNGRAGLEAKWREQFARLDTNKDGKLTLAEFMASVPSLKTNETPDQLLQRYDTNHDGRMSPDEFRAPEVVKFNRADLNHDGIVTPAEIQAARGK